MNEFNGWDKSSHYSPLTSLTKCILYRYDWEILRQVMCLGRYTHWESRKQLPTTHSKYGECGRYFRTL